MTAVGSSDVGHGPVNGVPFCQKNVRLWIALLSVASVLVLGFAIWLAMHSKRSAHAATRVVPRRAVAAAPPAAQAAAAPPVVSGASIRIARMTIPAARWNSTRAVAGTRARISFHRIVEVIGPAVVNINAVRSARPRTRKRVAGRPTFVDPFDGVPDKVFGNVAYESVGSGVIVHPAGYVVTNEHLVAKATSIVVTRYNHANENISARVVASDSRSDLALLKLEGPGPFPAARLANSANADVGDWVLAIGNPFGLRNTVTAGIISGRRPSLVIDGVQYTNLLQTDAPINRGSSGGPLIDVNGRVVGINTAIYAPTGVFSGAGFAIPSNRVGAFVARVLGNVKIGPIERPAQAAARRAPPRRRVAWLGMQVVNVNRSLAVKLGLPISGGVFVTGVVEGSPIEHADVKRGDVLLALAGQRVNDTTSLGQAVDRLLPGKSRLVVWRNGKTKRLTLNVRGFMPR